MSDLYGQKDSKGEGKSGIFFGLKIFKSCFYNSFLFHKNLLISSNNRPL